MPVEFGWPLPKRLDTFKDLEQSSAAKRYDARIEFMGKEYVIPVWRVPIGLPKYRLLNGRTASLQQEWLANHPDKTADFFESDPEREEAQKIQHELLKKLIDEKELLPFFENEQNKQTEFIILDYLGFVINGNRRLCTWRELIAKVPLKYKHFESIDVAVLPKGDDKSIDALEATLQVQRDIRADYLWHALANMLLKRMKLHNFDKPTLSRFYELTEKQIDEYLDMREYAVEYMKSRGIEGKWSAVDDKEYSFKMMVKKRKQISSVGAKKIFEANAYCLLDDPAGGRLYEYIPDLLKYQEDIQKKLLEAFPVSVTGEDPKGLLGVDQDELVKLKLADIIELNDKNRDVTRDIIKETIETRRLLDKEKDSARYVLKQLQMANAAIQNALLGIKPESARDGVAETITNIEGNIQRIREWLK